MRLRNMRLNHGQVGISSHGRSSTGAWARSREELRDQDALERIVLALLVAAALIVSQAAGLRAEPAEADSAPRSSGDASPVDVGQHGSQDGALARSVTEAGAKDKGSLHPRKRPWYRFEATLEMGFLGVMFHRIQQGTDGTWFDYVKEGGQDNLFLFLRASAGVRIKERHVILFLYQPLVLSTQAVLQRDVTQEGVLFPAGTPVNLRYGFDFYRASYMYDFFRDPRFELAVGASMQIRNADITFTSVDGSLRSVSQNVGPVPALKVRGRYTFPSGWWLGLEADGMYTNLKFLNGSQRNVEGAILDASVRAGIHVGEWVDVFVNLRYVGGGARGGGPDDNSQGDGFTRNWIHLISLSLGLGIY